MSQSRDRTAARSPRFVRTLGAAILVAGGVAVSTTTPLRAGLNSNMWTEACSNHESCEGATPAPGHALIWAGTTAPYHSIAIGMTKANIVLTSWNPIRFTVACDLTNGFSGGHLGSLQADQWGNINQHDADLSSECGQYLCYFSCDCGRYPSTCTENCPLDPNSPNWSTLPNSSIDYLACN
jgi:hypothetical protein